MNLQTNFSLKKYNSLNINATAKHFVEIHNEEALQDIFDSKILANQKYTIIGNGTNILFAPDFYDGIILKNNIKDKINFEIKNNQIEIIISSGFDFDYLIKEFINFQQQNKIVAFGLENLALIPGNVGAAIVQNIGAYGVEQKDFFVECTAINLHTGEKIFFTKEGCGFNYRFSCFKSTETSMFKRYFITEAKYSIPLNSLPVLTYSGLKKQLDDKQIEITPLAIYNIISEIRNQKIPSIEQFPNAGSFFKNPVVSQEALDKILSMDSTISYFSEQNIIKISAASLIEHCGLKGKRIGDVGISDKHSLILINYGNATGKEIVEFANYVIQEVLKKYSIELVPEVVFVI